MEKENENTSEIEDKDETTSGENDSQKDPNEELSTE